MALVLVLTGCNNRPNANTQTDIVVTNSYLAAAVADVSDNTIGVFSLAPPGMCPGHFDISPGQMERICNSRLLLLFDFQQQVERSLARVRDHGVKTAMVESPGGLCLPDTYLFICRQVCGILVAEYPNRAHEFEARLNRIEKELDVVGQEIRNTAQEAKLVGTSVLTSYHQASFAEWLGLEVVAQFVGSDTETVSNIDECLKKAEGHDIRFVIANKQEGTALAQSLAARLDAHDVVFSNFPAFTEPSGGFRNLVRSNVAALIEASN